MPRRNAQPKAAEMGGIGGLRLARDSLRTFDSSPLPGAAAGTWPAMSKGR